MHKESYANLEDNIMMFYIGGSHSASKILEEQSNNYSKEDKKIAQLKMCDITRTLKEELQNNNVDALGELLNENWKLKKSLASGISNLTIDEIYKTAIVSGAIGGKLLGAGGAGFMIFYVPKDKQNSVKNSLYYLRQIDFKMENTGSSIIYVDNEYR